MPDDLSIEELVIDDTFVNYCFQNNEEDRLFWEDYIRTHPSQKEKIAEAMQLVLGLHTMLKHQYDGKHTNRSIPLRSVPGTGNKQILGKMFRYAAAITTVLVISIAVKKLILRDSTKQNSSNSIAVNTATGYLLLYKTAKGEKKTIILPDSSKLILNAGSELRVDKDFGKSNRTVYLTGEALFDVTHNKLIPFIVHIDQYDVKVLGTLFNVKAYPDDGLSETSLIRGKVEISLKNNLKKITLEANQKAIIDNTGSKIELRTGDQSGLRQHDTVTLLPLSYSSKDSMVIETAWTQNRLEIVNERFTDMKEKLERWYNIKITFKDKDVSDYTFSATFENETIREVLQALQNAYHFSYEIKENEITISK